MRRTTFIVSLFAVCALALAALSMFSVVNTHAQSSPGGAERAVQDRDRQPDPEAGASATQDVRPGRGTYWAAVYYTGTVERGMGVVSSVRGGAGSYRVTFTDDVSKCAFTATLAAQPFGSAPGQIEVSNGGNVRTVFVNTHDNYGYFSDRGFHLVVNCG